MRNYIKRIAFEVFWEKIFPELQELREKQRALETHLGVQVYKPVANYQVRETPKLGVLAGGIGQSLTKK